MLLIFQLLYLFLLILINFLRRLSASLSSGPNILKAFPPDEYIKWPVVRTPSTSNIKLVGVSNLFDMNYNLDLVSTTQRLEWIRERFNLKNVIYMGDGIFDGYVMQNVGYSIAPSNSYENTKSVANYVTKCAGGERAVAEACIHILNNFFEPFDSIKPSSFLKFTNDKL